MFATQQMWFNFIDFLLNLIKNLINQNIDVIQQYANALQCSNQMIQMFATHLNTLKHQLLLYNDEHKWTHLFIKLKSELRVIITNVQLISITWNALINFVTQLKINLWKEHILSLKQYQDENLHDWNKVKKKIHSKWKKFHWSIRFNFSSKTSSYASLYYSKNLFNIMCYICNQKNYYFNDCKDEKIKNRFQKFDANQVFINSMLHMSHFKFFYFFSSLSACNLWLWHCLDAVCMLSYM